MDRGLRIKKRVVAQKLYRIENSFVADGPGSLTSCVTSGRCLDSFEPQYPYEPTIFTSYSSYCKKLRKKWKHLSGQPLVNYLVFCEKGNPVQSLGVR